MLKTTIGDLLQISRELLNNSTYGLRRGTSGLRRSTSSLRRNTSDLLQNICDLLNSTTNGLSTMLSGPLQSIRDQCNSSTSCLSLSMSKNEVSPFIWIKCCARNNPGENLNERVERACCLNETLHIIHNFLVYQHSRPDQVLTTQFKAF
jgi:hypothetical protein